MIIFEVRCFFANSWNVRLLLRIHEMVHDVGRKALVLFLFHLGLFLEACISYLQRKVEKKQRLFITISRILFNKKHYLESPHSSFRLSIETRSFSIH